MRHGPKRQSLNLRIKVEERGLIDRAAKTLGKNRTDFVPTPPAERPKTPCLTAPFHGHPQSLCRVPGPLDAPPQPNERLRKTMRTKAPWE